MRHFRKYFFITYQSMDRGFTITVRSDLSSKIRDGSKTRTDPNETSEITISFFDKFSLKNRAS